MRGCVGGWRRKGCGFCALLDEEDEIAFGIVDAERAVLEWLVNGDVVGFEIALEGCGIACGEGYGLHA